MKKIYILLTILALHSLFVIISMNQPFHGDEVIIPEAAKGVLKTGIPKFDYGVNNPNFEMLQHIPLYIYIISGFIYLFGYNVYSIRAVVAIFNFLVIILVYLIAKEILKENEKKENWALLAAFIYALNPLVIQNSILIDIDGGILNFSIYLFLYIFIKTKKIYFIVPSLILVFLSKEVGPFILFGTIFLSYIITLKWKKIPSLFILFISSGLLSIGIIKLYSMVFNLNLIERILIHNFGPRSPYTFLKFMSSLWEFKNFFYFVVPFFAILFLIFTFIFYYRILKRRDSLKESDIQNVIIFNLLVLLIILFYIYVGGSAWGFPKYQIIAVPAMSIFTAYMLSKSNIMSYLKKIIKSNKILFILLNVIFIIYFLFLVKNPLVPEIDATRLNVDITNTLLLVFVSFCLYVIVPLILCFFIFSLMKIKWKFFISLIYLTFFIFFYLNILHASVDYSTYSKYGDFGIPEVINYLKEKNIPSREIATHAHLGSYLNMSEYYEITSVYNSPKDFKKEIIENKNIKYIVIWERDIGRIGENMNFFELDKKIGTYYIFKKNRLLEILV